MIIFAFDTIDSGEITPNLQSRDSDAATHAVTAPFSKEFDFLRYLDSECIPYTIPTTGELRKGAAPAIYPIQLTHFIEGFDYISLISAQAREMLITGQLKLLFYFSHGIAINVVHTCLTDLLTKNSINPENLRVIVPNYSSTKPNLLHFSDSESAAHYAARDTKIASHVNVRQRPKAFSCITEHRSNFGALIAGSMWYHGLATASYFSYLDRPLLNDPNASGTNVFKWNKFWADTPEIIENFNMHVPFVLSEVETTAQLYSDAYWSVVIAQQCDKVHAHVPRAIFNPIMNMQPFMTVGPQYTLRTLRDMGYGTFSEWMDEGYDKIKSDEERLNVCFQMIYDIAHLPHKEHMQMIKDMIPLLVHNQGVLLASKKEQYHAAIKLLLA